MRTAFQRRRRLWTAKHAKRVSPAEALLASPGDRLRIDGEAGVFQEVVVSPFGRTPCSFWHARVSTREPVVSRDWDDSTEQVSWVWKDAVVWSTALLLRAEGGGEVVVKLGESPLFGFPDVDVSDAPAVNNGDRHPRCGPASPRDRARAVHRPYGEGAILRDGAAGRHPARSLWNDRAIRRAAGQRISRCCGLGARPRGHARLAPRAPPTLRSAAGETDRFGGMPGQCAGGSMRSPARSAGRSRFGAAARWPPPKISSGTAVGRARWGDGGSSRHGLRVGVAQSGARIDDPSDQADARLHRWGLRARGEGRGASGSRLYRADAGVRHRRRSPAALRWAASRSARHRALVLHPAIVIVRGRVLYPERPQFPLFDDRSQSLTVRAGLGADIGWGVRIGVGVAALAEIVGAVVAATDVTGRAGRGSRTSSLPRMRRPSARLRHPGEPEAPHRRHVSRDPRRAVLGADRRLEALVDPDPAASTSRVSPSTIPRRARSRSRAVEPLNVLAVAVRLQAVECLSRACSSRRSCATRAAPARAGSSLRNRLARYVRGAHRRRAGLPLARGSSFAREGEGSSRPRRSRARSQAEAVRPVASKSVVDVPTRYFDTTRAVVTAGIGLAIERPLPPRSRSVRPVPLASSLARSAGRPRDRRRISRRVLGPRRGLRHHGGGTLLMRPSLVALFRALASYSAPTRANPADTYGFGSRETAMGTQPPPTRMALPRATTTPPPRALARARDWDRVLPRITHSR